VQKETVGFKGHAGRKRGTCPASSLYVQVHYFRIRRGSGRVSSIRIGKLPRTGLLARVAGRRGSRPNWQNNFRVRRDSGTIGKVARNL
jgi:hypothetical protein